MAKIILDSSPISSQAQHDESENFTINYWGSKKNERMFALPFWKVSQLMAASPTNQVALRISNITDPNLVMAEWVPFNGGQADTLKDPTEYGIYYFILDDSSFYGPILTMGTPPLKGIRQLDNNPENNIIWGRLGSFTPQPDPGSTDPKPTQYYTFFLGARCTFFQLGAGGGGPACGVKVPPEG